MAQDRGLARMPGPDLWLPLDRLSTAAAASDDELAQHEGAVDVEDDGQGGDMIMTLQAAKVKPTPKKTSTPTLTPTMTPTSFLS